MADGTGQGSTVLLPEEGVSENQASGEAAGARVVGARRWTVRVQDRSRRRTGGRQDRRMQEEGGGLQRGWAETGVPGLL